MDVPGARLWYDVRGEGPAVVFTHAGVADHRMWEPQLEPFAAAHRVICWDQRGYGLTTNDATPYSTRADLLAILDRLGIERAALIGCSMGGGITLSFTIEHPARVGALVLIAPGIAGFEAQDSPEEAALFALEEPLAAAKDWAGLADLDVHAWVDGVGQPATRVAPPIRELVRTMSFEAHAAEHPEAEHIGLEPPAAHRLSEVRAPTLLLLGDLDVSACRATIDFLEAGIARARRHDFRDAAHLPNLEHPAEFDRVVLDFLAAAGW